MNHKIKLTIFIGVAFLANLVGANATPESDAESAAFSRWKAHKEKLKADPSLVRYYLFEEKKGAFAASSARDARGTLTILSNSPYGMSREGTFNHAYSSTIQTYPEWVSGRWTEKGALSSGKSTNVVRSLFSGTQSGVFTLEAWVRIQNPRDGEGSSPLFNISDGNHAGWSIAYQQTKAFPHGAVEFRFGSPGGPIAFSAGPFDPMIWHQLVGQWDGKMLRLFIDGALAGEKECAGPYIGIERNQGWSQGLEAYDVGGFHFGGGGPGVKRFDLDEVAIFDRDLSAEEIHAHFEAGRPAAGPEAQAAAFAKELERREAMRSIKMDIPKGTFGIFRRGDKIPAKILIPASAGLQGSYEAHFLVRDIQNMAVLNETRMVTASTEKDAQAEVEFTTDKCGLYFVDMWLTGTDGNVIHRLAEEYGIAVTVPLPPASQIPLSSPLMAHWISGKFYENQFLGFGVDRIITGNYNVYDPKTGVFDEKVLATEMEFERKAGLKVMCCIHIYAPEWAERAPGKKWVMKDMKPWEDFVRQLYRHCKDRVAFWEIENEPNAGLIPADEYVEFLKVAYKALKEEDPKCVVLGLCGCPGFLNWNEAVFKAGGAKDFDVLTLHNYNDAPIRATSQERLVERAIVQLVKYRGERVPVWNSESGVHPEARIDGRPMTDGDFVRTYSPAKVRSVYPGGPLVLGADMPVLTEPAAAALQVQTILLDLGSGCEKFFMLNGASHYSPSDNASDGQPSITAPAIAALASLLIPSQSVTKLPFSSSSDAGAIITQKGGRRIAAMFSDEKPTRSFQVDRTGTFEGMDMLGNPLKWEANAGKVLTVQLGLAPVYIYDVPENFAQIQFLKIAKAPEVLPESGIMVGELTISNPLDIPLHAVLKPEAPKGATLVVEEKVELQPKESRTIPFRLDGRGLNRRRYELGFQLLDGNSQLGKLNYSFLSEGAIHKVDELRGKPVLGDNMWWKGLPPESCADVESVVSGQPVVGAPWLPQWKGSQDLSFELRTAWLHDNAIFLRVDVADDVVMPASKDQRALCFKHDCVELFFDGRSLTNRADVITEGAQQIMVIPNAGPKAAPCDFWFAGKKSTVQAQFIGGRSETGYWIEGTLRPEPGTSLRMRAGTQFAFDVLVDDMDVETAPRKAAMALHGIFSNFSDPSKWGRYELEPASKGK